MFPNGSLGFLQCLPAQQRDRLRSRAKTVRARRGQTVLAHGERTSQVFIVTEGKLNVVLYSSSGRKVSFREIAEGEMFGDLAAIDDQERSVSIVAATDVRLVSFLREDFSYTIRMSPEAADWMMRRLAAQVRDLTDRVFELSALTVQARLHCELLRLWRAALASGRSEICPVPTHSELAYRIGSHREAVTRELTALAERNVIRKGRKSLAILDVAKLEVSSLTLASEY